MSYYSRTALRELKKRYLNILKKCFLANLMAFSFILPVQAETVESTLTPSEELETVIQTTRRTISSDTTINLAGKNWTYRNIGSSSNGGAFYVNNSRKLEFIQIFPRKIWGLFHSSKRKKPLFFRQKVLLFQYISFIIDVMST